MDFHKLNFSIQLVFISIEYFLHLSLLNNKGNRRLVLSRNIQSANNERFPCTAHKPVDTIISENCSINDISHGWVIVAINSLHLKRSIFDMHENSGIDGFRHFMTSYHLIIGHINYYCYYSHLEIYHLLPFSFQFAVYGTLDYFITRGWDIHYFCGQASMSFSHKMVPIYWFCHIFPSNVQVILIFVLCIPFVDYGQRWRKSLYRPGVCSMQHVKCSKSRVYYGPVEVWTTGHRQRVGTYDHWSTTWFRQSRDNGCLWLALDHCTKYPRSWNYHEHWPKTGKARR